MSWIISEGDHRLINYLDGFFCEMACLCPLSIFLLGLSLIAF